MAQDTRPLGYYLEDPAAVGFRAADAPHFAPRDRLETEAKIQNISQSGQAVGKGISSEIQRVPAPSLEGALQPDSGTIDAPGRLGKILSHPAAPLAFVAGMGFLTGENPADGFARAMAATGAYEEIRMQKQQQMFQESAVKEQLRLKQQQVETERRKAETGGELGKGQLELQGLRTALQGQGLTLDSISQGDLQGYRNAQLELGYDNNDTRIIAAAIAAKTRFDVAQMEDTTRKGALFVSSQQYKDRLKVAILKILYGDSIIPGMDANYDAIAREKLQSMYKFLPWMKDLINPSDLAPPKPTAAEKKEEPSLLRQTFDSVLKSGQIMLNPIGAAQDAGLWDKVAQLVESGESPELTEKEKLAGGPGVQGILAGQAEKPKTGRVPTAQAKTPTAQKTPEGDLQLMPQAISVSPDMSKKLRAKNAVPGGTVIIGGKEWLWSEDGKTLNPKTP